MCEGRCLGTLTGHDDEVLDVGFDFTGQYLLSASADGTGRIYNATTHQLISKLQGHEGEISKVTYAASDLCSVQHLISRCSFLFSSVWLILSLLLNGCFMSG